MSLLQWLDHLDKILFVLIQHDSDHALLDPIMLLLREPLTWVPFYIFMGWYAFRVGKNKAWAFVILSVLTFAITDTLTAQVLKPLFGRLRPCHDPEIQVLLRGLVDCGGLYSMPSNHAANHFGLATFWYLSIRSMNGKNGPGFGSGQPSSAMPRCIWENTIPLTSSSVAFSAHSSAWAHPASLSFGRIARAPVPTSGDLHWKSLQRSGKSD